MWCGIDCRTTIGVILRDMRRAAASATAGDKIGGVKVLVATHGAARSDIVLDHIERGGTLSPATGLGQSRINLAAISPSSSRSRFLQKTVASHTGSSVASPTNQRNSRL